MLPDLAFYKTNALETEGIDWNAKLMGWELTWLSQLPNDKQTVSAHMFPFLCQNQQCEWICYEVHQAHACGLLIQR